MAHRANQTKKPLTICLETIRATGSSEPQPLKSVLEAQKELSTPIQLLPIVIAWRRAPKKNTNPVFQFLMGRTQLTSTIRQILNVVIRSRRAFVQVGEPVQLTEFVARVPEPRQERALRILLRRFLKRETNVIRGPRLISRTRMMELVLNNEPMNELARQEATATGQSVAQIRKKMQREYKHMAARFRYWMIPVLDLVLRPLWTKVYSGVDIPTEDLEKIRTAMRRGTVVLAPCHKSHFDYVLISWVLYDNKLIIPHVVAGANLAIPLVSWVLRSAGGFFIKRSFSGERLHPKILARYVLELTRQGYPLEFYIEGGRTRSGKFNAPKLGVLGMVLDAASARPFGQEVTILPISIAYDRVAEQTAYAKELGGANKTQESLGEFARATGVLRNRYGRVYIRVGDAISTEDIMNKATEYGGWKTLSRHGRGELLQYTGDQIIHKIGEVTVVLPNTLVAMGLLAHHRRGLTQTELFARLHRLRALLHATGAPFAKTLGRFDEAMSISLSQFESQGLVESVSSTDDRVWAVSVKGRIVLDYYKNHCLHLVMTSGLVAAAFRGLRRNRCTVADLVPGFTALQWMLRKEFIFSPETSCSGFVARGLNELAEYGALKHSDGTYELADITRISELYSLFRSVLEAYWIVLITIDKTPRSKSDTIKALHGSVETLISEGTISRPEAITDINLKNAIRTFQEDGVLTVDAQGRLNVSQTDLEAVMSWLQPMVNV